MRPCPYNYNLPRYLFRKKTSQIYITRLGISYQNYSIASSHKYDTRISAYTFIQSRLR